MKILKKHRILIGSLVILFIVLIFFFIKMVYLEKSNSIDISQKNPIHKLDVKTMIDLIKNEDKNFIKPDEVIEIDGVIKEINYLNNRITILLGTKGTESNYVICDMQSNQKTAIVELKPKDTIKLKGLFKGILADVILLNCVISN